MKRLLLALGFLTRLPVPPVEASADDFAKAIRYYPIAGLAVGAVVAAAGWLGGALDPWIGALAALAAWIAITGALHLDGLGDLADGLGAGHGDRGRLIVAMADPHAGSFAVVAIALQMLAKLVLLHVAAPLDWWAVALIPAAARIGPLAWARWLPPLKPGLGQSVAGAARRRDLVGWMLVLAGACVALPALIGTPLLVVAYAGWLRHRVGGINGDAHGAGIELVETGLLVTLVAAGRF